ncbi:MAG: Do family serine endopeptidase [Myxococcales bacterium]|nr:Do family serine endopeptidase [Myxococcales bacterium]
MNQRRIGIGFAVVALAGVATGFLLSARLDFTSHADAQLANGATVSPPAAPLAPLAPTALALPAAPPPAGIVLPNFVGLVKIATPAVVHIDVATAGRRRGQARGPFIPPQEGLGTGFIISADGYILTNDHVVSGADVIRVRLADEREFEGKVVGTDPKTDVALVKIDAPLPLPVVTLGDSDRLQIGEWVVAIGSPFGLDHTVTAGIVSAKGRREVHPGGRPGYHDFIQTDASINPGNSGGPLLDAGGQVIGINSAISAQGAGIGFAIPINMVKALIPLLKQHGRAPRSWLGVSIQPLTQELARSLGRSHTGGALVAQIVRGGPADLAGLHAGDVIVEFDGKKVVRSSDLPLLASTAGIGRTVPLVVETEGKTRRADVTLGELPDEQAVAAKDRAPTPAPAEQSRGLGATVETLGPALARRLGLDEARGAVVVAVDPRGGAAGSLMPGDVVLEANRRAVTSAADFTRATSALRAGSLVRLLIVRDGVPVWLAFAAR